MLPVDMDTSVQGWVVTIPLTVCIDRSTRRSSLLPSGQGRRSIINGIHVFITGLVAAAIGPLAVDKRRSDGHRGVGSDDHADEQGEPEGTDARAAGDVEDLELHELETSEPTRARPGKKRRRRWPDC